MRARGTQRVVGTILLITLAFGQGCIAMLPPSPSDLAPGGRIRLASDAGFVIRQAAPVPSAPALEGRVRMLYADLVAVRGDTLSLRHLRFQGAKDLGTGWRLREGAVVVLSENPGLRPERYRVDELRTAAMVVIVPVVVLTIIFAASFQTRSGF